MIFLQKLYTRSAVKFHTANSRCSYGSYANALYAIIEMKFAWHGRK